MSDPDTGTYAGGVHLQKRSMPISVALQPWISEISVSTIAAPDGERTIVEAPDPSTALALRIVPDGRSDLVVMGPRTRALYYMGEPGPPCLTARIQTGRARLLLGRSVTGLLNRVVSLSDLWGDSGEQLAHALAEVSYGTTTIGERPILEQIEQAIIGRLSTQTPGHRARSDLVHHASLLLTDHAAATEAGSERVPSAAARLNVSERHLRNLFTEAVGIAPKHYARIDRLRTVLARAGNTRQAQLAIDAGYYDQSHMNAEFRRMMGIPVGAYLAARLPSASPCSPHRTG